jgi:hypothetical protein
MVQRLSSRKTKAAAKLPALSVGDDVRVSTQAMTEIRAMGEIKVKSKLKKGELYGFSRDIYKVVEIKTTLETRHTIFILFMYENSMRNSMKNSMVYHLSPQT